MRVAASLLAVASCVLAKTGDNCNIVNTVTVVSGDTLGAISAANGVTVAQVAFVNRQIANVNAIFPGDKIAIPNPACDAGTISPGKPVDCNDVNRPTKYIVQQGETLFILATERFGVTLEALEAANPQIKNKNLIFPGDVVNVPACAQNSPPNCANGSQSVYTAVQGDYLSAIATKFGITLAVIEAANTQIADFNKIYPGDRINITLCHPTSGSCPAPVQPSRKIKKNRIVSE
ncbi:uncharacterized protein RSE6_03346 [Rhynchosporium secalis]|uniref:LysM domain-containing protein n=1 Tax=Rhynchosporium secalis TaxID=38038 RepID=A0A1E1M2J9_RHYSE|nr:uncharacterized protein RSE6_03346 [Rhynchosporium secalis]